MNRNFVLYLGCLVIALAAATITHNDSLYSPTPERVRMREEAQARMKERLDSRRNPNHLVPGWPF